jgi:hypothetical protein
MRRSAGVAVVMSLLLRAEPALGQVPVISPTIAGMPVSCPVGQVFVPTVFTPGIPGADVAFSTFVDGQPVILLHPNVLAQPPALQLFMYGHECAHRKLLHALGTITIDPELRADCWSIQRMAQQGLVNQDGAQAIAAVFFPNPANPPLYPAGPARAQNILACFQAAAAGG